MPIKSIGHRAWSIEQEVRGQLAGSLSVISYSGKPLLQELFKALNDLTNQPFEQLTNRPIDQLTN